MIVFQNPVAFVLVLLIPALYILRKTGIFSRISFPLTLSDWNGKTFVWKGRVLRTAAFISDFLAILVFLAIVCAFADPVIHHHEKIYISKGTDILFVLDTSPSMAAQDITFVNNRMNRLEAAKIGINTLVENADGISFGLVVMASEAAVVVPPTDDREFFNKSLESVQIGTLGDGTAIGIGLSTAVCHLVSSSAPKKCIVLITDGENNAGTVHPETAAKIAAENGINLYTFGIGTKGSFHIEYVDPETGKVKSGSYESDFDPEPLINLAELAGGRYFGIDSTAQLSEALASVSKREGSVQAFRTKTIDYYCYDKFLLAAGILFLAAWIIRRLLLSEVI